MESNSQLLFKKIPTSLNMNPTDLSVPDPSLVLELLEAFRKSKVMFAAVELGVFDVLNSETTLNDLVNKLQCDRVALMTLLDTCTCLGLLTNIPVNLQVGFNLLREFLCKMNQIFVFHLTHRCFVFF